MTAGRPSGDARRERSEVGREAGAATVLVAGAALAVLVVLGGALVLAGVVADVHRARSAADLAALAAAAPLALGGGPDCPAGASVAAANGARLTGCVVTRGGAVEVTVGVDLRPAARRLGFEAAVGRARAGLAAQDGAVGLRPSAWGLRLSAWGQRPVGGGGGGVEPLGLIVGAS